MSQENFSSAQKKLIEKINQLTAAKEALILAHNYQTADIFEVADEIGDSFELAKKAMNTDKKIIVFAGVHFMAESAKLLNPEKKVLIPDPDALCPMAAMVNIPELKDLKNNHPKAAAVCYINTTAETKSECDYCVTSANAVDICRKIPQKQIIFLPDQHLASYVGEQLPKKEIIPFQGYCHVHTAASEKKIQKALEQYPDAELLIHPESPAHIRAYSPHILGTGSMIQYVSKSKAKKFLIATEHGMCARLMRLFPDREFIPLLGICPNMKKITLEKIYEALLNESNEINIPEEIAVKARIPLERMMGEANFNYKLTK